MGNLFFALSLIIRSFVYIIFASGKLTYEFAKTAAWENIWK